LLAHRKQDKGVDGRKSSNSGLISSMRRFFACSPLSRHSCDAHAYSLFLLAVPKTTINAMSESVDDYLKAILELGGAREAPITTNALAERLNVRAPSVTGMLKKLAAQKPALILYKKREGVRLTAAGTRRAWELVRHHRLLELFLHDVLKYSWDEVHEEAERLEHFISERFEDRVAAILGDPEFDPHGHVIPAKHEPGVYRQETSLFEWPLHRPAQITSVSDRSAAILRDLERRQMRPGVRLTVESRNPTSSIIVRVENHEERIRLERDVANCVWVAEAS
jgi:DtxR family transcriptional regulator, Mn-dependent transcriptional regulator